MKRFKNYSKTVKGKVTLVIAGGSMLCLLASSSPASDLFEVAKNIDIFTSVYKELNTYYVDDLDPNKLMRTGVDAMLGSLDPYTNYISEAEMEGYKFQITGNYGGIGATIRPIDGKTTVTETFEGFAAEKAGLQPGDIILEIDGKVLEKLNEENISSLLRGSPGSSLKVKALRPYENKEYDLIIVREDIDIHNVPYYGFAGDGIGYIILTQFTDEAGKNVEHAYRELQKQNPAMKGVILDLRGNPGGLLREAVNVSNIFIDKGLEVCSTLGKVKEWDKRFAALNPPVDTKIPLIVLASRSSASASEIVAGVMQDYDRGIIVGDKTFGKGLVQTTRDISYNTKLKLTTAKYYIPSGRCIQALDYSHRNDDGSVGQIPDSLKSEFKTKNGRTVYSGGGVDPDVDVAPQEYKEITISLLQTNLIFNYATKYKFDHPTIAEAKTFSFTNAEYDAFVNWLSDKEYDYTTETEEMLKDFETTTKEDAYYDAIKADLATIKSKVGHDKQKDLYKFKDEILYELNSEIVSRYYNQDGRIEASFKADPDILKAAELINNREEYEALLMPEK